jgi:hypothetical protein
METSLFNRLQATLLAVVTAGLVLLAVLNFIEERHSQQPDDGVWWREAANGSGLVPWTARRHPAGRPAHGSEYPACRVGQVGPAHEYQVV